MVKSIYLELSKEIGFVHYVNIMLAEERRAQPLAEYAKSRQCGFQETAF